MAPKRKQQRSTKRNQPQQQQQQEEKRLASDHFLSRQPAPTPPPPNDAGLSHEKRNFNLKTGVAERQIILGLESIADINQRKAIVQNLSPSVKQKLLKHLNSLVRQRATHRISPENGEFISSLLSPHEKSIKLLLVKQNRQQLGSGIFTFLIATLVPVIAELIRSATS